MWNITDLIRQGSVVPPEKQIQLGKYPPKPSRKAVVLKQVDSPVKYFPGHVILRDPMTPKACLHWEQAIETCGIKYCPEALQIIGKLMKESQDSGRKDAEKELQKHMLYCIEKTEKPHCRLALRDTEMQIETLPAIIECVEEWHIKKIPEHPTIDTFPFTPVEERSKLIAWLIGEINMVWKGNGLDEPDPNA